MSVCSATTAASARPRPRGSRSSSTGRLSLGDVHFMNDRAAARAHHPRKYSQVSTTKKSSSTCCTISVVMTMTLLVAMVTFYLPPMG